MVKRNLTIWVMVVVLCLASSQAMGLLQFKDGGTHNIDYEIADEVWIDYQSPGIETTVNLLDGGVIRYAAWAFEDSSLNILGGVIESLLEVHHSSQVSMSGGYIRSHLYASENTQATIFGGSIGGKLIANMSGVLTIHGSNFVVDSAPFGYGELTSIIGGHYTFEPYRHLTGTLFSGESISNDFCIGYSGKIVLVPEPATLLLLGLGGLMLRRRRHEVF